MRKIGDSIRCRKCDYVRHWPIDSLNTISQAFTYLERRLSPLCRLKRPSSRAFSTRSSRPSSAASGICHREWNTARIVSTWAFSGARFVLSAPWWRDVNVYRIASPRSKGCKRFSHRPRCILDKSWNFSNGCWGWAGRPVASREMKSTSDSNFRRFLQSLPRFPTPPRRLRPGMMLLHFQL